MATSLPSHQHMNPQDLHQIARQAMLSHGMNPDFSSAVQAESQGATALQNLTPEQRDTRTWLWCSIDNDDSLDLDQLTFAQTQANGTARLFVAIADVQAMVAPNGPMDTHARANTTSVYTAAGVFSMLPERLSTDLTSLNPAQDRAAMVIELDIDAAGQVIAFDVYRAMVHNHARLSYDSVATWLDGKAPAPIELASVSGLEDQLQLQAKIAKTLQTRRQTKGALGLKTTEARPVFTQGVLSDMRVEADNTAKDLIASFMIAANGAVARYLEKKGFPSIRRVLREPARWSRIQAIAAHLGQVLPDVPSSVALSAFLQHQLAQSPEKFPELSLAVVKLLGAGQYMLVKPGEVPIGHFGLAASDYTHATAPNRRYVDLITHRLLTAALNHQPVPLDDNTLAACAQHCNDQQKNANKVERHVRKSASALLLVARIGEHFDAIVTGVSSKGIWVRVLRPVVEGRLVQGRQELDVGDKIEVVLSAVDAARGFIDFQLKG
jgi:VacB/RNase II family 3'-5' exoribonuclease